MTKPKPRGFAALDPERQREIASMGGRAAHKLGRGHRFTSEEARAANRKGQEARALRLAEWPTQDGCKDEDGAPGKML